MSHCTTASPSQQCASPPSPLASTTSVTVSVNDASSSGASSSLASAASTDFSDAIQRVAETTTECAARALESHWRQQQRRVSFSFELKRILASTRAFQLSDKAQKLLDPTIVVTRPTALLTFAQNAQETVPADTLKELLATRGAITYGAWMRWSGQ